MSVAPTRGPVERPGEERDFTEIFQRLDDLERAPGGGWQFNKDNEGGWGYVITNDSIDIDLGILGMVLGDRSAQGMLVFSQDVGASQTGSVLMTPDSLTVALSEVMALTIDRAAGTITLYDITGVPAKMLEMTLGSPDLHLPIGGNVIFDL